VDRADANTALKDTSRALLGAGDTCSGLDQLIARGAILSTLTTAGGEKGIHPPQGKKLYEEKIMISPGDGRDTTGPHHGGTVWGVLRKKVKWKKSGLNLFCARRLGRTGRTTRKNDEGKRTI